MELILPAVVLIIAFLVKQVKDKSAAVRRGQPELPQTPSGQPGQYAGPPAQQAAPPRHPGQSAPLSAQVTGLLQQLMAGQTPTQQGRAGQYQASVPQYQGPGPQFQAGPQYGGGQQYPAPQYQNQPPYPAPNQAPYQAPYQAQYQAPQAGRGPGQHRPPQNNLPAPQQDLDNRIRALVAAHNEVGAIRLLCDERDMGILEAQEYTRTLTGKGRPDYDRDEADTPYRSPTAEGRVEEDDRYVGSAAFATSVFDTDADENQWASGWVEQPEPDDRTDMDELWQTVRNAGTPRPS